MTRADKRDESMEAGAMDITVRTIAEGEFAEWRRAGGLGFGFHATAEDVALERPLCEPDRTFAAFEGRRIVGTTATRTSSIVVPGGVAALGFVDDVAVLPTHRRRGIMTRMMRAQLGQMREFAEPLAALHASESVIYGRFGFGIATWAERWRIPRVHAEMAAEPDAGGVAELVDADEARAEWPPLHRRAAADRAGMVMYGDEYWRFALADAEHQRRGASAFFHVAYKRGGRVAGMASYRIVDRNVVLVVFLLGEDAEVEAELWRYCFGIDLKTEIRAFNRPTDDPLTWRLEDPRRLERVVHDHTWLRLVDVAAALEERRYGGEGALSIRVRDRFCAWNDGVYALETGGENGEAEVRRLPGSSDADIELGAADLAAAYLGGATFSALARAGRAREGGRGALRAADGMFRTARHPSGPALHPGTLEL